MQVTQQNKQPKIRQSSTAYFTILSLDLIQIFIGRKRPSGFSFFAKYISLPNRKNKNCKSRQVGHLKGAKNRKRKCANQNKKETKTENILQTIKLRFATYLYLMAAEEYSEKLVNFYDSVFLKQNNVLIDKDKYWSWKKRFHVSTCLVFWTCSYIKANKVWGDKYGMYFFDFYTSLHSRCIPSKPEGSENLMHF